jgi:hypothetical protein
MRKILLWLVQTRFWSWLLLKEIPYIRFTTYYASFPGKEHYLGYGYLNPGDFILTVDRKKLTTMLVPGTMTHAAFCVGHAGKNKFFPIQDTQEFFEVAEMTHHGFTKSWWFDICKESDRVLIMTCMDWTEDDKAKIIARVKSFQHAAYDVAFTLGVNALYCSELVYQAETQTVGKMKFDLTDMAGLGQPYISPDGLMFSENSLCLYDSDYLFTGLRGCEVLAKLESLHKS